MNSFITVSVAWGCFEKLMRLKSLIIPASLMISSESMAIRKESHKNEWEIAKQSWRNCQPARRRCSESFKKYAHQIQSSGTHEKQEVVSGLPACVFYFFFSGRSPNRGIQGLTWFLRFKSEPMSSGTGMEVEEGLETGSCVCFRACQHVDLWVRYSRAPCESAWSAFPFLGLWLVSTDGVTILVARVQLAVFESICVECRGMSRRGIGKSTPWICARGAVTQRSISRHAAPANYAHKLGYRAPLLSATFSISLGCRRVSEGESLRSFSRSTPAPAQEKLFLLWQGLCIGSVLYPSMFKPLTITLNLQGLSGV